MSTPRFQRLLDEPDLCSARYKGHSIDCTRHWRHRNHWLCSVHNKAGELVADYSYEGHDRRAMLEGAARAAGLLP